MALNILKSKEHLKNIFIFWKNLKRDIGITAQTHLSTKF